MAEGTVLAAPGPSGSDRFPDLAADRARALALTPVSRETADRLDRLVALLLRWQQTTNLVAAATLPHLWTRHVADSLQLLQFVPAPPRTWVDLGSGGGFPGLVIACAQAERPNGSVHLVESNGKKCAFLREAVRLTGARAVVHCQRIAEFAASFPGPADVVSARALAPLPKLLAESAPLLKTGTVGLFPKGREAEAELTAAAAQWTMDVTVAPSLTAPDGRILIVRRLEARAAPPPCRGESNSGPRRHD